jgi:hypothetical protein
VLVVITTNSSLKMIRAKLRLCFFYVFIFI